MSVFFFLLGLLQCFLIWIMGNAGFSLADKARRDHQLAKTTPPGGWPRCAMIIPVAGAHPHMEISLRSLLNQDYPDCVFCMVTESADEPAAKLIADLRMAYPALLHVAAGKATLNGQKNHNTLAGLKAVGNADIYVFCDSTHVAAPDFLRCLVNPIARNETAFTTGYHQVSPGDNRVATLGYAMSVLFMRLLQGMSALTQPWGGAMAIRGSAFEQYGIAGLWETNVVDDCSLAAWLRAKGIHVKLCPGALLLTFVESHPARAWRDWLERQILFLKFCIHGQWLALGAFCAFMIIPPLWCAVSVLRGLFNIGGGTAPFLALCWFLPMVLLVNRWRTLLPDKTGQLQWAAAFFCSCGMFALTYLSTIFRKEIVWRGICYRVGSGGKVMGIRQDGDKF